MGQAERAIILHSIIALDRSVRLEMREVVLFCWTVYLAEYLNVSISDIIDQLDDVMLFDGDARFYAENYIEDIGLLDEMPENLRYYFDREAFARDMLLLLKKRLSQISHRGTILMGFKFSRFINAPFGF